MDSAAPHTEPRRWRALATLALVQFMIVTDNTIANVALPSIRNDLGFTTQGLSWVVNGYLLTAGGLVLLGGRLSDLAGRRRMFLGGTALFGAASLVCGLAPSAEVLIAARFAQGAGEALASPAALSLIALLFPHPGERGKALGIWGGLSGLGATVGVVLSGVLTQLFDWRWVFFINLPFACAALLLVPLLIGRDAPRGPAAPNTLDVPGALLMTAGATTVVYGLLASVHDGWTSTVAPLAGGVAALFAFVAVEARTRAPLVPLGFFAHRVRISANLAALFLIGVMAALFLLLTLYLQGVLGYSPLRAGLAYLPFCVCFVAAILASFAITARLGIRATLVLAFVTGTAGMVWLGRLTPDAGYLTDLLPALLVLAVGFGLAFPGLQTAALQDVSEADAGLAAGVQTAVQALANALGIGVLLTIALHRTADVLANGATAAVAETQGYATAFRAGAASLVVGAVIVGVALPRHLPGRLPEGSPPSPSGEAESVSSPTG